MKTLLLATVTAVGAMALQPARPALHLAGAIPLPGVDGHLGHLSLDVASERLYVAALDNNSVEIVDLAAQKVLKSIPGFRMPQGGVLLHDRIVAANGGSGRVVFLDANTYAPTTAAQLGEDPYDVRYDAAAGRVYVGSGSALTVLDTEGHTVGTIKLKGHPEGLLLESSGPRIFVAVPSAQQIAVVDREKRTVIATWPVTVARESFPMALDEIRHRLFIGCLKPERLLVYDSTSGRFITGLQVVGGVGDVSYDAARKRIYVSGDGEVTVVEQSNADDYRVSQRLQTSSDARASAFVPELNQLLLAVPHHGSQRAEIRIYSTD